MRDRSYWLAELVAWPAAMWGGIEFLLRLAAGYPAGAPGAGLITACAILTIYLARTRRGMLTAP